MTRWIRFVAPGVALVAIAAAAVLSRRSPAGEQAWTGEIVDSICGVKRAAGEAGAAMTDRECTLGCVRRGARYALLADGRLYAIDNQHHPALPAHAGELVRVTGRQSGEAITVADVLAAEPPPPLAAVFPAASAFSAKEGSPPHFTAYRDDPRGSPGAAPIGLGFWTTDIVPDERGFKGPIAIFVGMDTSGTLTGIVVARDPEPYGYLSIERPAFAAQFRGKSIRDPFRVGGDVDAVSRATISVSSATRAIRDSARIVARRLLPPAGAGR